MEQQQQQSWPIMLQLNWSFYAFLLSSLLLFFEKNATHHFGWIEVDDEVDGGDDVDVDVDEDGDGESKVFWRLRPISY